MSTPTPRVDFYQLGNTVCVSVFIKNLPKDSSIQIEETQVHLPGLTLGPLFSKIDPAQSNYKIFGTKVELNLHKADPSISWTSVLNSDKTQGSSPAKKMGFEKNWDKVVDHEIEADSEEKKDVNGFFEQLYANADDDTKRAMMKSYIESNGTTLSTNWDNVGQRKVEPADPKLT